MSLSLIDEWLLGIPGGFVANIRIKHRYGASKTRYLLGKLGIDNFLN